MQDFRIDGMGTMCGGEYGNVKIDGLANCQGDITAKAMDIDGKFKMTGAVTADLIDCDGMWEIDGRIHAKKVLVDGFLTVMSEGSLEAEEIDCDGYIHVEGQISADLLKVNGLIKANEIVGDTIIIKSNVNGFFKHVIKKRTSVHLIEATTIQISGVKADIVNGHSIVIGPRCIIETLDCSGTLKIDATATVKTITGNYTTAP